MAEYVTHTLEPLYDGESRVLILGTMPSPKSRAVGFYYSHPQNRFWRVLADVFQQALPVSKEEKVAFCLAQPHCSVGCSAELCHRRSGRRKHPGAGCERLILTPTGDPYPHHLYNGDKGRRSL